MYSPLVHPSSFYSYLFIPLHLPLLCVIGMFSSTVFFSAHTTLLNRYKQTNRELQKVYLSLLPPPQLTHLT